LNNAAQQETHNVVGVAFAGMADAEGMGFIIPTPVVKNFLRVFDKTGDFEGLPALGISTQDLVNKSLRKLAFGEVSVQQALTWTLTATTTRLQ